MATSNVGGLVLPLDTTSAEHSVLDPVVVGLADYFAFWIRHELNTKLAQLRPGTGDGAIPDPLPSANVFYVDPQAHWVRDPLKIPALYVWWPRDGRSKVGEYSTVYDKRERDLRLMYVAGRETRPKGALGFSGLPAVVDAILTKASARGRHPEYGYNGDAFGTPIHRSLAPAGALGWEYTGGYPDFYAVVPNVPKGATGGNASGYEVTGFPVLLGTVHVVEKVLHDDLTYLDRTPDIVMTVTTGPDTNDPIEIGGGILPFDDGEP
jgi:hypothetical protein